MSNGFRHRRSNPTPKVTQSTGKLLTLTIVVNSLVRIHIFWFYIRGTVSESATSDDVS